MNEETNVLNDCSFIGNIGKDPELKTGQSGTAYCSFSIAVNKGSGTEKETLWLNITAFGKTAEFVGKNLKKGSLVYIKGELKLEKYAKDGIEHTVPKILASRIVSLSRAEGNGDKPVEQVATANAAINPDDIPF